VITKRKKLLELHFVKLGCRGHVKRAPHSIKWCLDEAVSPQPTSRDRVMHLFRENSFPVSVFKGVTGGYQTLAPDTVIKIRTFHRRLPVADKRCSSSKVCMFFQPLIKCSAGQLLLHRGGVIRTYTSDLSQYKHTYSLHWKASVALLSSDSGVIYSIIRSLIFKENFILVRNCVVTNNIVC
jgi:hypothetical protein